MIPPGMNLQQILMAAGNGNMQQHIPGEYDRRQGQHMGQPWQQNQMASMHDGAQPNGFFN